MTLVAAVLATLIGCRSEPAAPVGDASVPDDQPALVNGDFRSGLDGWTATGDAERFRVFTDQANSQRWSVTTFVQDLPGGGGTAKGTLSQTFRVPDDAAALRFVLHGGHERVRLMDGDRELQQAAGPGANERHIPVSWSLRGHRGKELTLVIEDDDDQPPWAFVSVSGFDVIRAGPSAIANAGFEDGLDGWEVQGDAAEFTRFRDVASGNRWSVSTAVARPGVKLDEATGVLSQSFEVPQDAIALRFAVHGGARAAVTLWDGDALLYAASGQDTNRIRVPVSWDLEPYRGRVVKLAIEDRVSTGSYAFIGTTGFDLITQGNGP